MPCHNKVHRSLILLQSLDCLLFAFDKQQHKNFIWIMLIDQLIKSIEVQTFLLQRHITLWSLTVSYIQVCYEPINDQLPVGFLAQLVRALHWCRRSPQAWIFSSFLFASGQVAYLTVIIFLAFISMESNNLLKKCSFNFTQVLVLSQLEPHLTLAEDKETFTHGNQREAF